MRGDPHGRTLRVPLRREETGMVRASRKRWITSVFGDVTRSGSWPEAAHESSLAVFGDVEYDLRSAPALDGDRTIAAIAPFGDIAVRLPVGVPVDAGGVALLGSKRVAVGTATATADRGVVRIRGFTVFGSFRIWND